MQEQQHACEDGQSHLNGVQVPGLTLLGPLQQVHHARARARHHLSWGVPCQAALQAQPRLCALEAHGRQHIAAILQDGQRAAGGLLQTLLRLFGEGYRICLALQQHESSKVSARCGACAHHVPGSYTDGCKPQSITPTVGIMRFSAFCSPPSGVTCVLHSVCQSCTFTSHSLYAEGTKCSGSSCGSPLACSNITC